MFVFVCAAVSKEKMFLFPKYQPCRVFREPGLSSSFFISGFLKCPFANMASFALGRSVSTTHAVRDFARKTGQPVQTRDGGIRLCDCWDGIQSNFNWQVDRILKTFLLSPKYTELKKKKRSSDGAVLLKRG